MQAKSLTLQLIGFTLFISHLAPAQVFNMVNFGAQGHGKTNDRGAIQRAIDPCSKAGGGNVFFPPGRYLSGSLRLRSHVTLEVGAGVTLLASTKPQHYENRQHGHLLVADGKNCRDLHSRKRFQPSGNARPETSRSSRERGLS